ncbi:MAG: hypothetical protein LBN06_10470 [Prevotellaceae bacterium]|jgi:CheY-like chemotaxis protein|nr:hypothetical protein [Prevotellaceae bacterium]
MKQILFVEDNGSYSKEVKERLSSLRLQYDVTSAYTVLEALSWWEEKAKEFDCIVLDLQINPEGLETDEYDEYAPLYGMAFLDKILKDLPKEEILKISEKVIISSAFLPQLDDWLRIRKRDLKSVTRVRKSTDGIGKLVNEIERKCGK